MKALRAVMVLVLVQGLLVGGYFIVEASRTREEAPFTWERLDVPLPVLDVERGGQTVTLGNEATLVHFWATWCLPCREELPALLAATAATGVPLVAVTDEPWPVVERYFKGEVPYAVARDVSGEAAGVWEVSGLPDTFLVQNGRILGRMGGVRDWESERARRFLVEVSEWRSLP